MRQLIILSLCLAVFACSTDDKEEAKGVIPEHQLKAMEDARKTEELMQKKLEDTDRKIEDASE